MEKRVMFTEQLLKKENEQKHQDHDGYRIMFTAPQHAELQKFQIRDPMANEVLVKVFFTLISNGTEKAYLSGMPNTAHKFPVNLGYSSVGIVVQKGSNVKEVKEGDRVFVSYGGHASYNLKTSSGVIKIPDGVKMEDAVFLRLASFPLLALRRARVELGESVTVSGLGMLGLFGVQLAKIAGGLPVIAIGNREIRRKLALECGADYVFDPNDENLSEKIITHTKVSGIGGSNVVLETSGSIDALISALPYTARWGRILVNGCNRNTDKPIDLYKYVHLKGISIIGAHDKTRYPFNSAPGNWTARRDYMTLLGYMQDGRLKPGILNPCLVSPKDATEIYDKLLNDREFPLGVIFDWRKY